MAGLFPNQGQGLLGGMFPPQEPMPQVPFRQNPVVTAIGAGLLQGPNMSGKYDFGSVGPALVAKTAMQDKMAGREEQAARRKALSEIIKNYSGLSPDDRAFYMANPEKFDPSAMKSKDNLIASDKPIYNPATQEWITPPQMPGDGALEGTGLDNQFWNIALEAQRTGNFDTPEYAAAYANLTQPRTQMVMTENGMVPVQTQPNVPAWMKPPPGMEATVSKPGEPVPGSGKPLTDAQAAASLYADRMKEANKIITKTEAAGTSLIDRAKSGVPVLGNFMVSDEYQQLEQAQRDFINATLRRESGAVINPEEFDNAKIQYFPQPGDTEATLQQKRRNRELAIKGIERAAGPRTETPANDDPLGIR